MIVTYRCQDHGHFTREVAPESSGRPPEFVRCQTHLDTGGVLEARYPGVDTRCNQICELASFTALGGARYVAEMIERETDAASAAADRKEAEIDRFGYGGDPSKPRAQVVGLGAGVGTYTDAAITDLARKIHMEGTETLRRPLQREFSMHGRWRVYFNRHGAEPLMWCIAPEDGGWEIAVPHVQLATVAETVYRKKDTPDEDDGKPSAWIAVEGQLTVMFNMATIGEP